MNNSLLFHDEWTLSEMKTFLDEQAEKYNNSAFIDDDPVGIPHRYILKEDIEISAFLTATISWGNRKAILKSANRMMQLMDESPYQFIMHHNAADLKKLGNFVHRTFNATDLVFFVKSLRNIYTHHNGLEEIFTTELNESANAANAISNFRLKFFSIKFPERTAKHISDPLRGSSAKRLNMYLRWMVRRDKKGVDFGLWSQISPSVLSIPLDVHSGNMARKLGLLERTQNDWKAVMELDAILRSFDPNDPVKYDFALFGLGAIGKF